MSLGALIAIAAALGVGGLATWLLQLARIRERGEGAQLRLHAEQLGGAEEVESVSIRALPRDPLSRWLHALLWRAGYEVSNSRLLAVGAALLALSLPAFIFGGVLAGVLAAFAVLGIAYAVMLRRAALRRQRIVDQLPNFLESVIRVLTAGNSLEESFAASARESSEPIRPLFLSVARQVRLGAPIDQVLTEAGSLYRLRDLRVLGLAAGVNRRYGGSIRNVLKSLILAIRQRSIAERELRALTAETRFSALVLALVPIGLSAFIFSRNTQYYTAMWHEPTGRAILITSLAMQLAGTLLLWRMLRSTEGAEA